jgi:hypothetical protein
MKEKKIMFTRNWVIIPAILIMSSVLFFAGCNKAEDFTIGNDFIESQTNVVLVDTFTVKISTMAIDSFPTNSDSLLLVGYYHDDNIGKVYSASFFQIGIPDNTTIQEKDVYDSITIKLKYTGYSYGDTNQNYTFSVHRLLKQPTDLDEWYNTTSLPYEQTSLATISFRPRPTSGDSIEIRLDDALGQEFFDLMKLDSTEFSNETNFLEFFNGLAIVPDSLTNNAMISFSGKDLSVILYSHRYSQYDNNMIYTFPITNQSSQFNYIHHNFAGTGLANFVSQRYDVSSTLTGDKSYLFGGVGLLVKFKFPYMQELLYGNRGAILKAELVFYPDQYKTTDSPLPKKVMLYETDKYNRFGNSILTSDGKSTQYATFKYDQEFNEETSYTFNLTNFFISEFSDKYFDPDHGLALSLPSYDYATTFNRLDVSAKNLKPKLRIYYVNY